MTFRISDYEDVFECPSIAAIPELKDLPQKTIQYLVYCYDSGSPIVKRSRDLQERKTKAATMAGIPEKDWDGLMSLNDGLVRAIVAMLKYQKSYEWSLIIMNEETFDEINRRVLVPVEDEKDKDEIGALEKKDKLLEIADRTYQRLRNYKASFYVGDSDLEQKAERIRFSPESIANHV